MLIHKAPNLTDPIVSKHPKHVNALPRIIPWLSCLRGDQESLLRDQRGMGQIIHVINSSNLWAGMAGSLLVPAHLHLPTQEAPFPAPQ